MDSRTLKKTGLYIILLNFIFPLQIFNILTLHLNLTIFVIGIMHLKKMISIMQAKYGHTVYENDVYMNKSIMKITQINFLTNL